MRILNYYVTKNYIATFFMAIAVLTFGMTGAQLMRVFEYLSRGIPISTAMEFLLYTLPQALSFTVPWASLVSIMLVFGRMSADNEITAMRACGVSILQIVSPVIVTTFLFTCVCLYLQLEVGPRAMGNARTMMREVAVHHPMALFTPGIPVEMQRINLLFDSKDEEGNLYDIYIYMFDNKGNILQDFTASRGKIVPIENTQTLDITLYDATITSYENGKIHTFSREFKFPLEYGKRFNEREVSRKDKYLTIREIYARSIIEKRHGIDTTHLETELNQRIALAVAPIAFLLLGLPLAIRTSRRETSIGLFISVLLAGAYFGSVMLSDALSKRPEFYPQYLVWIPPLLYQLFGGIYLTKISRM